MKNNRKKFYGPAVSIWLVWLFASCYTPDVLTGQTVRIKRDLPPFSSVTLALPAEVYLSQGDQQSVEIVADKGVYERIETVVRGGNLAIKTENFNWGRMGDIEVRITVPEIRQLQVTGSGNIIAQTPFTAEGIDLDVSGSGSIKIGDLQATDVSVVITGSGDVELEGKGPGSDMKAVITGSGDLEALSFTAEKADMHITGSGSARVHVTGELQTSITGSGDVYYSGNPRVNANATGSGRTVAFD